MVITRFAPSPTGDLHLGGARTALFNWLYARHYNGKFLLRMEDTDAERSRPEFQENILKSLRWLGLDWDGPTCIQSQRTPRHQEIVHQLLEAGLAYRCYCSPQELEELKAQALSQGRPPLYDRRWRDMKGPYPPGGYAVRLKTPLTGMTVLEDDVQGTITVDNDTLDDMILLRSDGTPTYMLAVVVDDHDMGVTYILRGDDHLTNAFRQLQLYRALQWTPPKMAHIPLIHNPQGGKLSKRHGADSVLSYAQKGILPQAMFNSLLRLGWSHGNEERISRGQAIEWFDGTHLSKSPARFDERKILSLNAHYMRILPAEDLLREIKTLYPEVFFYNNAMEDEVGCDAKALAILPELVQRAKTIEEVAKALPPYIFTQLAYPYNLVSQIPQNQDSSHSLQSHHIEKNDTTLDSKISAATILDSQQCQLLQNFITALEKHTSEWDKNMLESLLRQWCQDQDIELRALAEILRLCLTGQRVSPPLPVVMTVLGPVVTLVRLQNALLYFSPNGIADIHDITLIVKE